MRALTPCLLLSLLTLSLAFAPGAAAATLTERYVGFDSGYAATAVQHAATGCDGDTNVGSVCFPLEAGAGRTATVTLQARDDLGNAVPFGVVWWYGDGTGLSNLVLYCGDATVSHKAPASGITGVGVVIWGGHPAGLVCPTLSGKGTAYVPGLPGTVTMTY